MIVRFTNLDRTYILLTKDLDEFIKNNKRKSIPLNYFEKYGTIIKMKYSPRIDYLKEIDKIYFGGNKNDEEKNI